MTLSTLAIVAKALGVALFLIAGMGSVAMVLKPFRFCRRAAPDKVNSCVRFHRVLGCGMMGVMMVCFYIYMTFP